MLKKSTLDFLTKLKKNNNRDWFNARKHLYEDAKNDFEFFTADMIDAIARFDESVIGLEPKQCTFRIYNDIRFSKNKLPYKSYMGASMQAGGRKAERAGYYFHLSADECFVAGGRWMPEPEHLLSIRNAIASRTKEYQKILNAKDFKKYFGTLEDIKLKTAPKGFPKDHPAVEYLKYKSFIAYEKLPSKNILSKNLLRNVTDRFKAMKPLIDFLNSACNLPL